MCIRDSALLGIDTGTQISVNSKRNIKQTAQLMQQAQNSSATEAVSYTHLRVVINVLLNFALGYVALSAA